MFYVNYKWMLIICFFVHVIFLISIFDIYFKSPIVEGVIPQSNRVRGPAKRLVLFIGDGTRVDSFFDIYNGSKVSAPFLRQVIEKRGRWGISHTRVPTESRPGHVAIIAGFYEDPSAIFKGWKDNPIDFDSVFNRSALTLGWGSPDILSMFNKGDTKTRVIMKSYPSSLENFSGRIGSAAQLSLWSFESFKSFLENAKSDDRMFKKLYQDKTIIFLHLLGIDVSGHSDKPHSEVYLENIKVADNIARETEILMNDFYKDNNTAYIFTSDHGMTNWGSHGEGSAHETETPFVAWGAGILPPAVNLSPQNDSNFWKLNHLQRNDLKQADIAPLMSILLGITIPVNSVGVLPLDILNMTALEKSTAILLNAYQMLAQFDRKRELVEQTTLSLLYKPYDKLSKGRDKDIIKLLQTHLLKGYHNEVIKGSLDLISLSLDGLDYYHNYYQKLLLFCISLSYIGWIGWMFLNVSSHNKNQRFVSKNYGMEKLKRNRMLALNLIFLVLICATVLLLLVQFLPLQYYLYCCLPLVIWWNVFKQIIVSYSTTNYVVFSCSKILIIVATIFGTELVVMSFFERRLLSAVILPLSICLPLLESKKVKHKLLSVLWTFSCLLLTIFPFLPVIGGKPNNTYIILGALMWCFLIGICWIFISQFKIDRNVRRKASKIFILYAIMFTIALCNVVHVSLSYAAKEGLLVINQLLSWILFLIVPIFPLLASRIVILRLLSIYFSLGVVTLLFSVNHDALFLPIFSFHLFLWVLMEYSMCDTSNQLKLSQLKYQRKNSSCDQQLKVSDFRRAFLFFFYTVFSFFGTGNIASINSFDTSWVRCFITLFAPFTMMILILVKTVIPFFATACTFRAVNDITEVWVDRIFLIVLVYCDLMGLNFLFLVKNVGSWLEIGESVSHYVISQTIILFLVVLYFLSRYLTYTKARSLKKFVFKLEVFRNSGHID